MNSGKVQKCHPNVQFVHKIGEANRSADDITALHGALFVRWQGERKAHVYANVWSAAGLQEELLGRRYSLRKCIRPLVGDFSPGHDDDPRVPVLITGTVCDDALA